MPTRAIKLPENSLNEFVGVDASPVTRDHEYLGLFELPSETCMEKKHFIHGFGLYSDIIGSFQMERDFFNWRSVV